MTTITVIITFNTINIYTLFLLSLLLLHVNFSSSVLGIDQEGGGRRTVRGEERGNVAKCLNTPMMEKREQREDLQRAGLAEKTTDKIVNKVLRNYCISCAALNI